MTICGETPLAHLCPVVHSLIDYRESNSHEMTVIQIGFLLLPSPIYTMVNGLGRRNVQDHNAVSSIPHLCYSPSKIPPRHPLSHTLWQTGGEQGGAKIRTLKKAGKLKR